MDKLYVVHSSHPSETAKKALELKAIPYKTVEMLIPTQAPLMRLRFKRRTVPALRLDGGEKVRARGRSCGASTSSCPSRRCCPPIP